jgi:hypothetical protein
LPDDSWPRLGGRVGGSSDGASVADVTGINMSIRLSLEDVCAHVSEHDNDSRPGGVRIIRVLLHFVHDEHRIDTIGIGRGGPGGHLRCRPPPSADSDVYAFFFSTKEMGGGSLRDSNMGIGKVHRVPTIVHTHRNWGEIEKHVPTSKPCMLKNS